MTGLTFKAFFWSGSKEVYESKAKKKPSRKAWFSI